MILDAVIDPLFHDVKVEDPIKPWIRNFLVSGKIVTVYIFFLYLSHNTNGDKKKFRLSFTQDLVKISVKKMNNLPPKPKYVMETNHLKQIITGYGTKAFENCKSLLFGSCYFFIYISTSCRKLLFYNRTKYN